MWSRATGKTRPLSPYVMLTIKALRCLSYQRSRQNAALPCCRRLGHVLLLKSSCSRAENRWNSTEDRCVLIERHGHRRRKRKYRHSGHWGTQYTVVYCTIRVHTVSNFSHFRFPSLIHSLLFSYTSHFSLWIQTSRSAILIQLGCPTSNFHQDSLGF